MGINDLGGWNSMGGLHQVGQGFAGLQLNQAQQGMPQMLSQAGLLGLQGNQGFVGMVQNPQQQVPQGLQAPPQQTQQPQQQQQMMAQGQVQVGGFGPPMEAPFPVVKLRGLPFDCGDGDIALFFQGFEPIDILLCRKMGRLTGEAFVLFPGPMLADLALQKNRQNLGRRYIEVFRAAKADYYAAISAAVAEAHAHGDGGGSGEGGRPVSFKQASQGGGGGYAGGGGGGGGFGGKGQLGGGGGMGKGSGGQTCILKLRGLPFVTTKEDIVAFFGDITRLGLDSIHIVQGPDGRATGTAFVEFGTAEESSRAMSKHRQTMGTRYVEIFPSSRDEATKAAHGGR